MAERQGQRAVGPHPVVVVAEIGVTNAAARDFDHHLARARRERTKSTLSGAWGAVIIQRWAVIGMKRPRIVASR